MKDTEIPILRHTVKAVAATEPGRFLTISGAAPAAGGNAAGPAWTKVDAGDEVAVTMLGIAQVEISAAVAAGAALKVAADGRVLTKDGANVTVARALAAGAAAGDMVAALIIPN